MKLHEYNKSKDIGFFKLNKIWQHYHYTTDITPKKIHRWSRA